MKTYNLGYQSPDGRDYYNIVLDLRDGTYFQIKNASCTAVAENFICERFQIKYWDALKVFRIFHMGNDDTVNLDKIYKKYHKYFKKNV